MFETIMCWILVGLIGLVFLKYCFLCLSVCIVEGLRKRRWCKKKGTLLESTEGSDLQPKNQPSVIQIATRAYEGCLKYFVYKIGLIPSNLVRLWLYRCVLHMSIGAHVVIHYRAEIRWGFKISVGKGTIIGDNCLLDGRKGLTIGENVNFSSNVSVYTLQHDKNDPYFRSKGGPVMIKDRSWVSSNTMVLPGVTVGEGALVCGGAVVTKNVDDYSVVGGVPAKRIGERNANLLYHFDGSSCWFF